MFRRGAQVAAMAALLAIGIPSPSANAMGIPSLQSNDATVLVREDERWRGERRFRGGRRGDDDGWRFRGGDGWRFRGDDGWRFRGHNGWRGFREDDSDWRKFRRHRRLDDLAPLFGFGQRYFSGPRYHYFDDGYGRRRKAPWW
jgi:hypothetical protein